MQARRLAPWLLAPLLLTGFAGAHGGALDRSIDLAGETVLVQIHGAPLVVAHTPLTLEVALVEREAPTTVRVQWTTPQGVQLPEKTLARGDGPLYATPLLLAEEGTWRLRVSTPEGAEELEVPAWPAHRYFVAPAPALAEQAALVAGREETLALVVTDAQGAPAAETFDARAHVERWDEARGELLETRVLPLAPKGEGRYVAAPEVFEAGLLRVRVESAAWALAPDDRPSVDVVAVPPEEAGVYAGPARETPGPALGLVVLALAALALARRR